MSGKKSKHSPVSTEREVPVLTTDRLRLRPWRDTDLESFAAMNADPQVMEFYPKMLSRDESDASVGRIRDHFARYGYGLWAVEVPGVADFIGYVGLSVPAFEASFMPCVEIGWRLARQHWGQGYATEAARAALEFGFAQEDLSEIVSFTTVSNFRSRSVMERLGMTRLESEDFDHPSLPEGHKLRPHVLYRLSRKKWRASLLTGDARPSKGKRGEASVSLWRWSNGTGLEHCRLIGSRGGWKLQGTIVALSDGQPTRVMYKIRCDKQWRTEKAEVEVSLHSRRKKVTIKRKKNRWYVDEKEVRSVRGCLDIDLSWSPSTNTLPIRRLDLPVGGESGPIAAAWLRFPHLELEPLHQEYKRLSESRYLYSSRGGLFEANLEVDENGLVTDYEGRWERVSPTA